MNLIYKLSETLYSMYLFVLNSLQLAYIIIFLYRFVELVRVNSSINNSHLQLRFIGAACYILRFSKSYYIN